jgi:predicted Zn-ribbon and HTH transcriptional regulator
MTAIYAIVGFALAQAFITLYALWPRPHVKKTSVSRETEYEFKPMNCQRCGADFAEIDGKMKCANGCADMEAQWLNV